MEAARRYHLQLRRSNSSDLILVVGSVFEAAVVAFPTQAQAIMACPIPTFTAFTFPRQTGC